MDISISSDHYLKVDNHEFDIFNLIDDGFFPIIDKTTVTLADMSKIKDELNINFSEHDWDLEYE